MAHFEAVPRRLVGEGKCALSNCLPGFVVTQSGQVYPETHVLSKVGANVSAVRMSECSGQYKSEDTDIRQMKEEVPLDLSARVRHGTLGNINCGAVYALAGLPLPSCRQDSFVSRHGHRH